MKNIGKKLFAALFSIVLSLSVLAPNITVNAARESQEVRANKNGIVQVNVSYVDSSTGRTQLIQGGSGFLIGDDSTGAQTVITNYHVVNLDADLIEAFKTWFGVADFNTRIEVVVKGDVTVTATIENQSADADYAILKLAQPLYDKDVLMLDVFGNTTETEMVYALGFPELVTYVEDSSFYTSDDVSITSGTVSKIITVGGYEYIQHNATLTEGNSGGPLVNSDGVVIGVNTFGVADSNFYSLQMKEITEVLDTLGIAYKNNRGIDPITFTGDQTDNSATTETPVDNTTAEPVITVDKSMLQSVINESAAKLATDYTPESYAEYTAALDAGRLVYNNSDATQSEVDSAAQRISMAASALVPASKGMSQTTLIIIVVAIVAVVLIIAIILIVAISSKNKREAAVTVAPRPMGPPMTAPVQPQRPVAGIPPVAEPVAPSRPTNPTHPTPPVPPRPMPIVGEGAGETSVLNVGAGAGETSVLSASNQKPAVLTRLRTGEKIDIMRQTFKLGKERNKVDYCISNNNSVSRVHAIISYSNGEYFITDMNSTNNTFVNDQIIRANTETKLNSNDRIKLADEEFQIQF